MNRGKYNWMTYNNLTNWKMASAGSALDRRKSRKDGDWMDLGIVGEGVAGWMDELMDGRVSR